MDFVVGIPSFNDADSIENLATECDLALRRLGLAKRCVLVNADSDSDDGTADAFLSASTAVSKRVLSCRKGKGAGVRALAESVIEQGARGLVLVDADISFIEPEWIGGLLQALLDGFDAAFARRPPVWNRGDLTYDLCYPALARLRRVRVREPIAPTQAYSSHLLRAATWPRWNDDVCGFGVDFYLAYVGVGHRWTEVVHPTRLDHKLRTFGPIEGPALTSGPKFGQVLRTVREVALGQPQQPRSPLIEFSRGSGLLPACGAVTWDADYENLTYRTEAVLLDMLRNNTTLDCDLAECLRDELESQPYRGLSWQLWKKALRLWMSPDSRGLTAKWMEALLLGRRVGFYHGQRGKTDWYAAVERQVADFANCE